jgi:hypothetical protein
VGVQRAIFIQLLEMRFKPEIVALGLEVYPDNQVDKVRACGTAIRPWLRSVAVSGLPSHSVTLGLFPSSQIVTFVANFHKLVEMGFSPERIKQALLLHEDGDVQKAIMYVVTSPRHEWLNRG